MTAPLPTEEPTEISTDGILLVMKFLERFLTAEERAFAAEMKPGVYLPLTLVYPIWERLTFRVPDEMRAAIKGMVYARMKLLEETGARSPADALRVSNLVYQAFNRGSRMGGREVVAEGENEAIVDDSTWPGCRVAPWFMDAYVRAFGARGVRVEHLESCRTRGERFCRFRVRWSRVEPRAS
jgi:hypothetical protein